MKKRIGRKLMCFVLMLAMVMGMMPGMCQTVYAASQSGSDTFTASFSNNSYTGSHVKIEFTGLHDSESFCISTNGDGSGVRVSSLNGENITKVEITNFIPEEAYASSYDIGVPTIDGATKKTNGRTSVTFTNIN